MQDLEWAFCTKAILSLGLSLIFLPTSTFFSVLKIAENLSIDCNYNDGISARTTKHVNDHFYIILLTALFLLYLRNFPWECFSCSHPVLHQGRWWRYSNCRRSYWLERRRSRKSFENRNLPWRVTKVKQFLTFS